jgi:hypothetical protein
VFSGLSKNAQSIRSKNLKNSEVIFAPKFSPIFAIKKLCEKIINEAKTAIKINIIEKKIPSDLTLFKSLELKEFIEFAKSNPKNEKIKPFKQALMQARNKGNFMFDRKNDNLIFFSSANKL